MLLTRRWLLLGALVAVAGVTGCRSGPPPTPEGVQVFDRNLSAEFPNEAAARLGAAPKTSFKESIVVGGGEAKADVLVDTVTDPKTSGRYVSQIRVTVTKNESYAIVVPSVGNPINVGTVDRPVMAISFIVSATHENGREILQDQVTVRADGKVTTL